MQIYKITNLINNKIYIGKDTTSDPNYFGSGLLINRAFEKYGKQNFIKEIIDETNDYEELSEKEIYWIEKYNSTDRKLGYNISKGGDGGDVFRNHPDLDLIRQKISKNSPKKGKTYEESFGEEKAKEYKLNLSKSNKRHQLGKTYEELYGQEKSDELKNLISLNSKNAWNEDRKVKQSNLAKNLIHNSILSEFARQKTKDYLDCRWTSYREEEKLLIDTLIKKSDIQGIVKYLTRIPNSLFNNRKKFYEYIGVELHNLTKKELNKRGKNNSGNEDRKKEVIIDNIKYNSISEASKQLNIDRAKLKYRLKSSHFKNYLFQDNELNIKYNKFIEIDPYLSKKEPISIKGKEYQSITQASKDLDKPDDYITWRLNSKSYPDWIYTKKVVELKETGEPKKKRVSILGNEYDSIAEAVKKSGIDRQIMRYRLKSKNYPDYFYI